MTLSEFLLSRIAEDKAVAECAIRDGLDEWKTNGSGIEGEWREDMDPELNTTVVYDEGRPTSRQAEQIARWDPKRVLVDCAVKSSIIASFPRRWSCDLDQVRGIGTGPDSDWWEDFAGVRHKMTDGRPPGSVEVVPEVLKLFALPYADHLDYQQEWAL